MVEGAVAQVLREVLLAGERRQAEPLRALAAHLRHPEHVAAALAGLERDHRVAADADPDQLLGAHARRGVVRAAGAEVGGALDLERQPVERVRVVLDRRPNPAHQRLRSAVARQNPRERARDIVGGHAAADRQQLATLGVLLAEHPRRPRERGRAPP